MDNWRVKDVNLNTTVDIKERISSISNRMNIMDSQKPSKYHEVWEKKHHKYCKLGERKQILITRLFNLHKGEIDQWKKQKIRTVYF